MYSNTTSDEFYMQRCLQLAQLGAGNVSPNPMVGSVLVHNQHIIGEGYHEQYGKHHAEVNCINSVSDINKHLISLSTMYVSLEPCAHFGKTPPCADLIIKHKIPKVVVGCRDSFKEVNGKGLEKLINEGIEVTVGILQKECKHINKRFFTFHTMQRPFIILKWAETANHFIGSNTNERLLISGASTNRLVHKWRREEGSILVGTNTASLDNPSLNNRYWNEKQPIRMVIDNQLKLSINLKLFNKRQETIVFNQILNKEEENLKYYQLDRTEDLLPQLMRACYELNIQSILVEGGRKTLQLFIDSNLWDEARVITNTNLTIADGISSPTLINAKIVDSTLLGEDRIIKYEKINI